MEQLLPDATAGAASPKPVHLAELMGSAVMAASSDVVEENRECEIVVEPLPLSLLRILLLLLLLLSLDDNNEEETDVVDAGSISASPAAAATAPIAIVASEITSSRSRALTSSRMQVPAAEEEASW